MSDKFEICVEALKIQSDIALKQSQTTQLEIYALFKQATVGDCKVAKPTGWIDYKGKAKWDSWNEKKGMTQDNAKKAYVELLLNLGVKIRN